MNKQEEVMPSVEKLERIIKVLIVFYALHLLSKRELENKINSYIIKFSKILPKDLIDRSKYIDGAIHSSKIMINKVYVPIVYNFRILNVGDKPIDLVRAKKGTPNIFNYQHKVNKALKGLDRLQLTTSEVGKKPITLWQKTELDIRHEEQMKKVNKAKESGRDLFWLSSHADCSVRCAKWQGKLVSMSLPPIDLSMKTGQTINGTTIYSFNGIENIVDEYGYKNNIINGFNCRHHLIAYKGEKNVPIEFSSKDIAKERKINERLRYYEREVRRLKMKSAIYSNIDKKQSNYYLKLAKLKEKEYRLFAKHYGFKPLEYRLKV